MISSEDLLLIPEVIERGEKEVKGKGIAYKLKKDGVSYIVYNEIHKNQEQFCDFYTNRKGSSTHPSNTQLSAQVDSATTNSDTNVVENFENPTIESKKSALSADGDKFSLRKGGKEYRNNGYTQREDGTNISYGGAILFISQRVTQTKIIISDYQIVTFAL